MVGLKAGAAPGRSKIAVEDDGLGSTINQFATNGGTLQGHPGAAGAMAVGAAFFFDTPACGTTPAQLESYSSEGGTPSLFDVTGTRLATPVTRQKPDIVGPDGGNDTFLGFTLASQPGATSGLLNTTIAACQNNTSYPNFFGTSAATPHVAAIAALFYPNHSQPHWPQKDRISAAARIGRIGGCSEYASGGAEQTARDAAARRKRAAAVHARGIQTGHSFGTPSRIIFSGNTSAAA